ncbi:MAG: ECF transporter S component [Desulfurococcaceae archaeon]
MARRSLAYTPVDFAVLGAVAVIFGALFTPWWTIYYAAKALGGPAVARALTYGLWFMAAPLAASLIRKPLSALGGELLASIVETILPNPGGFTNIIYGLAQGLASEAVYAIGGYRHYGPISAALAGAVAAAPAVALDALLFGDIYPADVMALLFIAAFVSGAIYGIVAYAVSRAVR